MYTTLHDLDLVQTNEIQLYICTELTRNLESMKSEESQLIYLEDASASYKNHPTKKKANLAKVRARTPAYKGRSIIIKTDNHCQHGDTNTTIGNPAPYRPSAIYNLRYRNKSTVR